CQQYHNSPYTF
nr:immunoglobulin light chain junction region [Macaca mulatta]